ncbi:MAG: GAF and ANTAR domain-containing protein [Solirubrobacteraceae bacterium]
MAVERFIDPMMLQRSLASLGHRRAEDSLMQALQQVLAATRELFGVAGAGLMMVDDQSVLSAVAATDEPGHLLEVRQQEIGHGPCVDSLTLDRVITTADLAVDHRWPGLTPELPDRGVRAVLGVPVHVDRVPVGSLNVYHHRPGEWDPSEISALEAYSGLIESLLVAALQAHHRGQLAEQLQHALNHRVVIERAVGVIMGRHNLGAVAAFNKLRSTARSSQRKVADVAAEILDEIPNALG